MERDLVRGRGEAMDETEKIKILYTNAQSLFSKVQELTAAVSILSPDVVMLTETWTSGMITDAMIQIPGYRIEGREDRRDTQNGVGGGLIFYVKDCYEVLQNSDELGDFNQYSTLTLNTGNGPLNLILVYRPPSSNAANFSLLLNLLESTGRNSILIGDFNLPGIDWTEDRAVGQGRNFLDSMAASGLEQLVTFPTHRKGNILDLVITDRPEQFVSIEDVGCLGSSDHCMLLVELEITMPKLKPVTKINWKKGDYTSIISAHGLEFS
jgi:Endonuclease-reverse transcriptase